MIKKTIFLFILFPVIFNLTSVQAQRHVLKATIFEAHTNEVLPYANVYNKQRATGTASNLEGYFELPNNRMGDTIVVSYVGYVDQVFVLTSKLPNKIELSPNSADLEEIVVRAKSDFLYELVAKVSKNKRTKTKVSKTYFYLETKLFEEPIEIIESYYNGTYSNYGTDELNIKKGRIGLKPINYRYFSSTESSRLFSMHDLFLQNNLFPDNPLLFRKRKLKRKYILRLNHTYLEGPSKIYVIDFEPKAEQTDLFSGTVWIDQQKNRIIKINLNIQESKTHPFIPIGYNTIEQVDMAITKSYQEIDGELFVNNIDFNYNVVYSDTTGNKLEAKTTAFSKAYDFNTLFKLPYFEFTKSYHEDYRNITFMPYDTYFWNGNTEFRFYDRVQEVEDFIHKNRIKDNIIHPRRKADAQQLQFPYLPWNKKRMQMRQASAYKIRMSEGNVAFENDRYHLDVKLFLDVNIIQDSLTYQIKTILDPVTSFYHFYINNVDHAFMNMYFDLMEIQKRKLEAALLALDEPSIPLINALYEKQIDAFNKTIKSFVSETKRGKNMEGMEAWNEHIYQALNVDNLKRFSLMETK